MKKLFAATTLLLSFYGFSQEAYIMKKDSTKIIINPESIEVIPIDARIGYKLPGKTWEKYIRYKDLDYISYDGKKFKNGMFILAENDEVKMESLASIDMKSKNLRTYFVYRFVDKKANKVIKSGKFTSVNSESNKQKMEEAITLGKKYFSECPAFMEKVNATTQDREYFFKDLQYIECK